MPSILPGAYMLSEVGDSSRSKIHDMFDLKSSTWDRFVRMEGQQTSTRTQLDMNWRRKGYKIPLTVEFANRFEYSLKRDTHFFKEFSLYDYSLLVGIKKCVTARRNQSSNLSTFSPKNIYRREKGGAVGVNGDLFFLGIVGTCSHATLTSRLPPRLQFPCKLSVSCSRGSPRQRCF